MIRIIQLSFCFLVSLGCIKAKAQVNNECSLDYSLFLSAGQKGNHQWICGVLLETEDSANKAVSARLDIMKDWIPVDSLELLLQLDTNRLYKKIFRDEEIEMLRYFSPSGLEVLLQTPHFYEYESSNGMKLTSCSYDHALIVFPKKWRKYQKRFDQFFEK